jgi:hypothetical protein
MTSQITDITAKSEQFASQFDMSMIQVKRLCRNFGQSRPRQSCRILKEGGRAAGNALTIGGAKLVAGDKPKG